MPLLFSKRKCAFWHLFCICFPLISSSFHHPLPRLLICAALHKVAWALLLLQSCLSSDWSFCGSSVLHSTQVQKDREGHCEIAFPLWNCLPPSPSWDFISKLLHQALHSLNYVFQFKFVRVYNESILRTKAPSLLTYPGDSFSSYT